MNGQNKETYLKGANPKTLIQVDASSGVQGGIKPSSTDAVPTSGTKNSHSSANNSFTKFPLVTSFLHNNTMQPSKPQTPVKSDKHWSDPVCSEEITAGFIVQLASFKFIVQLASFKFRNLNESPTEKPNPRFDTHGR